MEASVKAAEVASVADGRALCVKGPDARVPGAAAAACSCFITDFHFVQAANTYPLTPSTSSKIVLHDPSLCVISRSSSIVYM